MIEISVIINGVRYDAVDMQNDEDAICSNCDLKYWCREYTLVDLCTIDVYHCNIVYKESNKSFER